MVNFKLYKRKEPKAADGKLQVEETIYAFHTSAKENWPFLELFECFKDNGVNAYEVSIVDTSVTLYGNGGATHTKKGENEKLIIAVAPTFNGDAVKAAVAQHFNIGYGEFMKKLASAGVVKYRVDTAKRTITYHGPKGESVVEPVAAY